VIFPFCGTELTSAIYIGQYTGVSITSKTIQWFTRSNRSHSSAFLPPVDGVFSDVIQAWHGGVTEDHWTDRHRPGTMIDIYEIPCTPQQQATFYASMRKKKEDEGYDFLGVIGFLSRRTNGKDERWFCSEAVYHSTLEAEIQLLACTKAYLISPAMLDLPINKKWVTRLVVTQERKDEHAKLVSLLGRAKE